MPLTNGRKRGKNTTYVVLMPEICSQHLVVLSINDKTGGWAIRDYLTNSILEDERSPRSRHEIESKVSHEEFPPFYNVEDELHFSAWEIYLVLRTFAYLRKNSPGYDTSSPNTSYGEWMPIPRRDPWRPVKL